jgi:hypothetical protein
MASLWDRESVRTAESVIAALLESESPGGDVAALAAW